MFISMVIHSFAVHIISNPQMVKISSTNPFMQIPENLKQVFWIWKKVNCLDML